MLGLSARDKAAVPADALCQESPILRRARVQLEEYLAGRRKSFELPLAPRGTDFQRKVWEALTRIPYGETRSYKQIAEAVGCPRGCRAVGLANNRNPISIVIPCHRVIGADGRLVGYGGGLPLKKALLRLEGSL
ncbi:methylated-DNA--[protein]-cysteine S-methyltransferase [Desulfovibrio sp. ZJ369]|uniref:methylated-DNA--[protein]-cysteine S-methyltransferase n=1 Tax=Desulfovibrio sp. ZJ369 TaxID=2709793 RepID=UPI0013EE08FD|nr:methylated-DNA--[protein]-cysteine S-methyltransferase [Desulfovibrio sp. ZJ369]